MKVLDVGSGAGDVALLLADLVGPCGAVIGVDMNSTILHTARGARSRRRVDERDVSRRGCAQPDRDRPGARMGSKLYATFLDAGLLAPQLRLDAPIGGGPDWPVYEHVADTVRSLLPRLQEMSMVRAEDVGIETLADRLRADVVGRRGVQMLPIVIGA